MTHHLVLQHVLLVLQVVLKVVIVVFMIIIRASLTFLTRCLSDGSRFLGCCCLGCVALAWIRIGIELDNLSSAATSFASHLLIRSQNLVDHATVVVELGLRL